MKVTVEMLQKHKACRDQVALFKATFPDGARVTEAACLVVADTFNFKWAACLLPKDARRAYYAQRKAIWAEYSVKLNTEMLTSDTKNHTLRVEYKRQKAALFGRIAENVEN